MEVWPLSVEHLDRYVVTQSDVLGQHHGCMVVALLTESWLDRIVLPVLAQLVFESVQLEDHSMKFVSMRPTFKVQADATKLAELKA